MEKAICIRLYTENLNKDKVIRLAAGAFPDGFTVYEAAGCWMGGQENSLGIEILVTDTGDVDRALETARQLAADIKRLNNQESVLLTVHEASLMFV